MVIMVCLLMAATNQFFVPQTQCSLISRSLEEQSREGHGQTLRTVVGM